MGEKSKSTKKVASPKAEKKEAKTKTLAFRSKETIEDSDEIMSSGGEEEESSEDDEEEQQAKKTTTSMPSRPNAPVQSNNSYKPPADFTPLPATEYSSKNPFSAKNLAGKEIWYITAPANVSLSSLTTLNPIDVAEGNPIMQADGRSYCLRTENDSTKNGSGLGLLVPDSTGVYRTAKQTIQKTFRIVEAPPTTFLAPKDMVPKPKPVKVQPKGLKQRFTPIGAIATGAEGGAEDVDMMDVDEPEPEVKTEERKKKKHKSNHAETEDDDKKKKKKKEKKSKAEP